MIRTETVAQQLTPAQRWSAALLVDLARLVPVDDPEADVVRLRVSDAAPADRTLRGCQARGWYIEVRDGDVTIPRAVLDVISDVAGTAVEQRSVARDRFDRIPSGENPLVAAGCEREPVISLAGLALRRAVRRAAGRRPVRLVQPWPAGRRWAASFTHDVDVVRWWPLFSGRRLVELMTKGDLARGRRLVGAVLGALGRDPVLGGVRGVIGMEQARDVRGTWFFLCGSPTARSVLAGDLTYKPESAAVRRIVELVRAARHEVGLHGSFATMLDASLLTAQRRCLERLAGGERGAVERVDGVRQHFLRMQPGLTQRAMVAAGFAYDATYGFADRNGFRFGAADIIPAWDVAAARALPLALAPTVWMDRALSKYRGIEEPGRWIEDGLELASAARRVEGLWVGLWHPNLTPPLGFADAPGAFERLVGAITAEEPYVAPLRELVRWREARRSVRVKRLAPDGRQELCAPSGLFGEQVQLEEVTG